MAPPLCWNALYTDFFPADNLHAYEDEPRAMHGASSHADQTASEAYASCEDERAPSTSSRLLCGENADEPSVDSGTYSITLSRSAPEQLGIEFGLLGKYSMVLEKSAPEQLGIDVAFLSDGSLAVDAISVGLVRTWNASHPGAEVRCGDRLLAANGIFGQMELVEECRTARILTLEFRRPSEAEVSSSVSAPCDLEKHAPSTSIEKGSSTIYDHRDILIGEPVDAVWGHSAEEHMDFGLGVIGYNYDLGATRRNDLNENLPSFTPHLSAKMNSGMAYMKECVGNGAAMSPQVSEKLQKGLDYAKLLSGKAQLASATLSGKAQLASANFSGKAQLASTTISEKISAARISEKMNQKTAQIGWAFTKRASKAGGA